MQLQRLALAAIALLASTFLQAQGMAWPTKPIRWIIPFPGGIPIARRAWSYRT
jgi:tripartite-type tricarboxylate transporter receptor subunit TctC